MEIQNQIETLSKERRLTQWKFLNLEMKHNNCYTHVLEIMISCRNFSRFSHTSAAISHPCRHLFHSAKQSRVFFSPLFANKGLLLGLFIHWIWLFCRLYISRCVSFSLLYVTKCEQEWVSERETEKANMYKAKCCADESVRENYIQLYLQKQFVFDSHSQHYFPY